MKSNQYPYNFRVGSTKTPVKTSFAQVYTPVKTSTPRPATQPKPTIQSNPKPAIQPKPKQTTVSKYSKKASVSIELPKTANTYLGPKGYTIYKSDLTETQIQYVKDALTIKPVTPGITLAATTTFPSYRESAQNYMSPGVSVSPILAFQRPPKSHQAKTLMSHLSVYCAIINKKSSPHM